MRSEHCLTLELCSVNLRHDLLLGALSGLSGSLSGLGLFGELLLGLLDDGLGLLALVGGLDQSGDGVGELSALGLPVGDLLEVEVDGLGAVIGL